MRSTTSQAARCTQITKAGQRCKNQTTNENKNCGWHDRVNADDYRATHVQLCDELIAMHEGQRDEMRRSYHLTLGELITFLQNIGDDLQSITVQTDAGTGLGDLISYRGYYADLAFEPADQPPTASRVLETCNNALNCSFYGYKGGDYIMSAETPLWVAVYGEVSDVAVIAATYSDHVIVLATKRLAQY